MRNLAWILVAAVVGIGALPASGASRCNCIGGYVTSGGAAVCTAWDGCEPLLRSADLPPVASAAECPDTRVLVCDEKRCGIVCDSADWK
jgi:hypothetical protein